jgi:hypothetical protein
LSAFIVISNQLDGTSIEMKVTYNSVGATAEALQDAVVKILPQAYMEIEKRLGSG